ncbi:acyl carrier protein [Polaribacter septentrionalilitoris]|uniref:acyl carrier protein n=1 Tax=Polaribacter septentrionalilitoris TaxID=2494657 RepID=UPI0013572E52|nr:acyl carrier protein [Polaribacter septentrionalilitoris]
MEKKFIENFKNILDEEPNFKLEVSSKFRDLDEWDSLTALSLIAMLDEEYNVTVTGDQVKDMETIEDVIKLIK